jgi:hypothetical protein
LRSIDETPSLPLVSPVLGLKPVGFSEMRNGIFCKSTSMKMLSQLEVCGSLSDFKRTGMGAADYLVRREDISRRGTVLSPITNRSKINIALDSESLNEIDSLDHLRRGTLWNFDATVLLVPSPSWFGWTDDHAFLIDPHTAGNVNYSKELAEYVSLIY